MIGSNPLVGGGALPAELESKEIPRRMTWIDPKSGQPARPFTVLPCLLNIRKSWLAGVEQGFGQHWRKQYQIRLAGSPVTPEEVIAIWRNRFADFWPPGNLFFPPADGIENGEIALLKLSVPGQRWPFMATGVSIHNVTPTTFTYTALAGHPIAGSMSFSAFSEDGVTVARAEANLRASDPLFELAIRLTGKMEDQFWRSTLENLATHFNAKGLYSFEANCLDRRLHWRHARNLTRNAAVRSTIYLLTFPLRFITYALRPDKTIR